ncbi:hypothetical protein F5887DRAFT_962960 [Amanita rubescens]|nr:hypothetical protein F5887DRAFT_962960 [Amanita rubescens]
MASRLETPNCLEERASSIVGEAPCSETKVASIAVDEVDTDEEISKLYANESVKEFWSRDALDERDTMLMEVPNLPPPNIHRPGNIFLSSKFSDFCLVSANTAALPHLNTATLPQFLKKVKGLQPLNVVLSWKAFSTKEPLPCHAELVGVSSFRISETSGVSVQAVKALIEVVRVTKSDVEIGPRTSEHDKVLHRSTVCGADMILTRRERWRRANVVGEMRSQTAGSKEGQTGPKNPTTFPPEITLPSELSPANDSTKLGINGVCIQHMTTSSELEEGGGTTLQLPPLEEVARRLWNNVKGTDLKNCYQIPVPTGGANWHETSIIAFAKLRSKTLLGPKAVPKVKPIQISDVPTEKIDESSGRPPRHIPSDIYTPTTLQLPSQVKQPSAVHYYMASLDVLQKQVLVRALREPSCFVELIERDNLGGADLIVDSFTAILYRSLFSLSSECDELIGLVSKLSWSFERLVIVLEAFSPALAMRFTDQADDLYAYTPPILKAIKRLRRGVDMVEADQEKRQETVVLFAFPNNIQEAAAITRHIGDMVQSLDQTEGVLWGDRSWLDHIDEDEENLATASGMNRFTSAIVLSQMTLDDFITMGPDDRHRAFSTLVGAYAVASFNADLENRISRSSSDIHHGHVRDPPYID